MRILLVVRHPVGGIRTFLRYFYPHFDAQKYSFVILVPDSVETDTLAADLALPNFTLVRAERNVGLKALAVKVQALLKQERFDLVHAHGLTSGMAALWGAKRTGTFLLVTLHDVFNANQFPGLKGMVKKAGLGLALSLVDHVHCVSHDAQQNLLAFLPVLRWLARDKVSVVMNGIATDQFSAAPPRDLRREFGLPPDAYLIGFLGRFMNQKGFAELVNAYEQLLQADDLGKRPMVLTFSAEDGFYREERAHVKERGLADRILFLPFVADVGPTLRGLDVVAMPSRWEACPLLPMEVLVAGTPLVGSDCVGLKEVLTGTPARMVPARDSVALATALRAEMLQPSGEQARAYVPEAAARFDVRARARELEALIEACLARRKV